MPGPKKPCPRCGPDGDVVTSAPGVAACRVCQGSFVSSKVLVPALIAAGVAPGQLKEIVSKEGRKLRPCPTCDQVLTTFPVRRETLHSCNQCNAMWIDDGALLRLGGIDPEKLAPAPLPMVAGIPLSTEVEGLPAAGPMKPIVDKPLVDDNPLGAFAPRQRVITADDLPYVPEVGGFSERSSGTSFVSLGLKLFVAVIFLGGLYYVVTTAMMKGEPTAIGGGYEALFWQQPIKVDTPAYQEKTVKRWVSPWGTNTLEAIYAKGGGGPAGLIGKNGTPEAITGFFHTWNKMVAGPSSLNGVEGVFYCELEFVDERDPNKSNKNVGGYCRYYFNAVDGWLLCGYSDSNLFARSGKSSSFVASFRQQGTETKSTQKPTQKSPVLELDD